MNLHVPTPTQAALAQARKEREARIKAAAQMATVRQAMQDAQALADARKALELQRRLEKELAKRKEAWRRSWRYMVQLAANRDRNRARHLSFKERQELHRNVETPSIAFAEIMEQTARKYAFEGITVDEMKSARRTRGALMQARFEAAWRGKRETPLSLPQIGRLLGGRDHTTILHAVRKYDAMRKEVLTGEKAYSKKTRNAGFLPALIITDGADG
jgi:chromosomal replication initiation ATPase DnaA